MMKHAKFTTSFTREEMTKQPKKRMNIFIKTTTLRKGFIALMLVFASTMAYSQCNPQLTLGDGTQATSGTFCVGQLIAFEANSPGYTTTIGWDFGDAPNPGTSTTEKASYSYNKAGNYTVTFTGNGFAGTCTETLSVVVKPSPEVHVRRSNDSIQCYNNNLFCFIDSTQTPDGKVSRVTYSFSDGQADTFYNPTYPFEHCVNFADPIGGKYDLIVEALDTSGCITKIIYSDYFDVAPKIGASYTNLTPPPNPACFQINGVFQNTSIVPFSDVTSFKWEWGNGKTTSGDQSTNQEWFNGPAGDKIVENLYTTAGTFFPTFIVNAYGCSDTFVSNVSVVNIILEPKISAPTPACAPYRPVFTVTGLNGSPVTRFLWNYGQPPWGQQNVNDQELSPNSPQPAYGPGVYMISLNVVAGPCDVTVYDTIEVVGPGTAIEAPGNRIPIPQTYQCIIEDSVCMTNASSFYRNDFDRTDEDSVTYYPSFSFDRVFQTTTGQYSWIYREWEEDETGNQIIADSVYALSTDTITEQGYKVYYDAAKDSIAAISLVTGKTTWHKDIISGAPGISFRFGIKNRLRYVFDAAQVAVPLVPAMPPVPNRDYRPNIWRVWSLGDNFAPQCTTDSRPWVNQNVGINCNYSIDSAPCHWYTPWDEIYRTLQDGRNYTQPFRETRVNKNLKECYSVNIYAADTMIVAGDTVLTIPIDSSYTYNGVLIPAGVRYDKERLGNWIVRRPPSTFYGTKLYYDILRDTFVTANNANQGDTLYWNADSLGRNNPIAGNGTTKWTVTYHEMEFTIPAGVTINLLKLEPPVGAAPGGAAPGSTQTLTGPQTVTIQPDWQISIASTDSISTRITVIEDGPDTAYAQPSNYVTQQVQFGILTRVVKQAVFIDSAAHRENWFLDNATCQIITLWQKDTIHPLQCESEGTKQLALIPPSAKGLEWVSGFPCPFDGVNQNYILEFSIAETKPGCTQQWFAVNYDTFSFDPTLDASWNAFDGGNVFGQKPNIPLPFVLPYDLVGNTGTTFFRGYTPGQIGDPYARNPIGSFGLGLIVGNGTPIPGVTPANHPARCLDTFYYPDLFRILPLDAAFEIVYPLPTPEGKYYMCPGDTAYFRFTTPLQDSIKNIRWNWGYPANGFGRGPLVSYYFEDFKYYQPYTGPVVGRNDENIVYNGEDWLYNSVIRTNTYAVRREGKTDVFITDTIETLVTSIIKDWKVIAIRTNADQIIKDLFEQRLGLNYSEIPADEVAYYLGPTGTTCIDTTGLSGFFNFGIQVYSKKNKDFGVTRQGDKIYRLDTSVIPNVNIETQHILHFRDSSVIGFDTLMLDTSLNGVKDKLTGLYRHIYQYTELVSNDECNPDVLDTVILYGNGPMTPGPILNSTTGCDARAARFLNVGFTNRFSLQNETLCNGLEVVVDDYIRYYQYGEEDAFTYPIAEDKQYWNDPSRYVASPPLETFQADWDATTVVFDSTRSLPLRWTYTEPGEYEITIVAEDSIGCTDTTRLTAFISDLNPDFTFGNSIVNCATIVSFKDSTWFVDPCAAKDTCSNGTDLSCERITSWLWDFGDGTRKSILQNPVHNFTSNGNFEITLIVTSELGCIDSIKKMIYIPGPQPEFGFRNEVDRNRDSAIICLGDPVEIINFGKGDITTPTFQMIWGDNTNETPGAIGDTFSHIYTAPGTYELYIIQEDAVDGGAIRCSRIFPDTSEDLLVKRKIIVIVYPRPVVTIAADPLIVCPNEAINFTATMDARYTRAEWIWGNGDSTLDNDDPLMLTRSFSYSQPGTYDVILAPEYDELPKCWDRDTVTVEVQTVTADFDIDSSGRPEFCFTNKSVGATSYAWTFEDEPVPGGSTEENPCYNWDDRKGSWLVCLIATNDRGCEDTICKEVPNTFIRKLIPYNVFTPGDDISNNTFVIDGESIKEYSIKIFNRWGERVFESEDITVSWNGKVNNTGIECPSGTYFYIINYTFEFGVENEGKGPIEGTVDLIR